VPLTEIVNDAQLSDEQVEILRSNMESRDDALHATQLNGCLRQVPLKQRYPFKVYTSKLYAILKGLVFHAGMQALIPDDPENGILVEHTFTREVVPGITLVGTPDLIDLPKECIRDWKVPTSLPRAYRPSHEVQLNIYHWLTQFNISTLLVTYFGTRQENTFSVPVWDLAQVEEYLECRVELLLGDALPPPEGQKMPGYCMNCPVYGYCQDALKEGK
jgi:hypothetical protein